MPTLLIYISGPITLGDREHNFEQACEAQKRLMARGISVINPILTMKLTGAFDVPHEQWMANDLPIIERCDAVLRLPGASVGADMETDFARKHNIPVFYSQFDLIQWHKKNQSSSDSAIIQEPAKTPWQTFLSWRASDAA